jgi:hypothetical protein
MKNKKENLRLQNFVSDELFHFVGRGMPENEQFNLLIKILKTGWLTHAPHSQGYNPIVHIDGSKKISSNLMYNPKIVCFCDIPLPDIGFHAVKYSHFGISFTKNYLIQFGARPVFYIPTSALAREDKKTNIANSPDCSNIFATFTHT